MPASEPKTSGSGMPKGPQNPYSTPGYMSTGYPGYASGASASNPSSATQTKRSYGAVFNEHDQLNQSLQSGMRPDSLIPARDHDQIQTQDGEFMDAYGDIDNPRMPLKYKRADGTIQAKKCPSPRDR